MSHRCTEIDCTSFDSILVLGKTKANENESNGVGKSVLFHAIKFALYGVCPTSVLDKVIRDGTDMCKVIFDFNINSIIYRIERTRKRGKSSDVEFKEKTETSWKSISAKTSSKTDEEIKKIIRISANGFESIHFSQNDLTGLASAKTAEERRTILKDSLDLGRYKKHADATKKLASKVQNQIDVSQGIIDSLGDPSKDIENISKSIIDSELKIQQANIDIEKYQIQLTNKQNEYSDLLKLVDNNFVVLSDKLKNIREEKILLSNKIKYLDNNINEIKLKIKSFEKDLEIKEKELIESNNNIVEFRNKPFKLLNKVKEDLEKTAQNEINGKIYIRNLENKIDELCKPLPAQGECPTCFQVVSDDYKTQYYQLTSDKISVIEADLADKRKKLKAVSAKKEKLNGEILLINNNNKQIEMTDLKIKSKNTEIYNYKEYIGKYNKLIEQSVLEINSLKFKLEELNKSELSLEDSIKLSSNNDVNNKLLIIEKDINNLNSEKSKLNSTINNYHSNLGSFKAQVIAKTEAAEKIKEHQINLNKLNKEYKLHKKIQKGFNAIPEMIISTIINDLQTYANEKLTILKDSLEIQFDSDLNLFFRVYGKEREFYQLSGAQKMMVSLSLKLAQSLVIQKRLGIKLNFLLLDEVCAPLDASVTGMYCKLIKELRKDFKVFVITHNDRVKGKFDRAIVIEGDPINGATASIENV
jgi:DNA repair exonuclease SbcCD ATPase subunit